MPNNLSGVGFFAAGRHLTIPEAVPQKHLERKIVFCYNLFVVVGSFLIYG